MKLDIYIKQNKSETSIAVELDGKKCSSMRKVIATFPDDVVKTLISIMIDTTIYHPINYVNIYCARKGLYFFLNKKEKNANLAYLDFLLGLYDSTVLYKKISEIEHKFHDCLIYMGSYKNKLAIVEDISGNIIAHKQSNLPSNKSYSSVQSMKLLHNFLQEEADNLKSISNEIYFMLDDKTIYDNLKQILSSNMNSDNKRQDTKQIFLECANTLKSLQTTVLFVPKYQNKACQYCKEEAYV